MLMYNYVYLLQKEPRTVHAWRQFDCLSFAQNFYNDRATLLEPSINNLGAMGTGKTASEFPIVPCIIGNIWKFTGVNSSIYKLADLLFLLTGLFFLYKLFLLEFKDKIIATLTTAFIFSSPLLSYYGVSTLSDVQSLSLALIGFYFFWKWLGQNKLSSFIVFLALFSLAGLLKASAAFVLIFCFIYFLIKTINERTLTKNLVYLSSFVVPLIFWFLWYHHVTLYNEQNNSGYFLIGLLPIWDLSPAEMKEISERFFFNTLPDVFNPSLLWGLLLVAVPLAFYKLKGDLNKIAIILCFLLFLTFVILFYGAMNVHDYYLLNPFALIVIACFFVLKEWRQKLFEENYKAFVVSISLITLAFTYASGIKTWLKINDNVQDQNNVMVFNAFERKNAFWVYWIDREMYEVMEDRTIDLDSIGIKKNDPVFCLGDPTINRALYLLDRRGYTTYNIAPEYTAQFLKTRPEVKFIILIDPHLKTDKRVDSLLTNKIFEKKSLSIYKIH